MTRAAIYARFSSDLQRDRSIDDQMALCREYAGRERLEVVRVFDDRARSGASIMGRDGLLAMMDAARDRQFDVLIVEALDRVSRDQEDLAGIYKRLSFAGVEIRAVHDGVADQIQVGIRGLVGALYLQDLRHKVRRGMAGVTRDGRHAGGRAYGYRPVLGSPGELAIVEDEAEVVRRIYREYADGARPREICIRLNAERIPAPRGNYWSESALLGNRARGHGILLNPLYGGEIVWNRTRFIKDPDTGRRVSRVNPVAEWQRVAVPHLAIVDASTFAKVLHRGGEVGKAPAWQARAPKRVLSGLLRCGCCGGGMSYKDRRNGRIRIHCTAARQGACTNAAPIYLDIVETTVLDGLKAKLKDKAAIALYLRTYNEERRALAANATGRRAKLVHRLAAVQRELDRLVGLVVKGILTDDEAAAQLPALRSEKAAIETEIATVGEEPKIIELHPSADRAYLKAIDDLEATIAEPSDGREHPAMAPIRQLIDRVIVTPARELLTIRLEGKLDAMIGGGQYPAMVLQGGIGGIGPPLPLIPPTVLIPFAYEAQARRA